MKISQREARRLRKRVDELEERETKRFATWATSGYPGGTHLGGYTLSCDGWFYGALKTARRLGCALVATIDDAGELRIYAVKK